MSGKNMEKLQVLCRKHPDFCSRCLDLEAAPEDGCLDCFGWPGRQADFSANAKDRQWTETHLAGMRLNFHRNFGSDSWIFHDLNWFDASRNGQGFHIFPKTRLWRDAMVLPIYSGHALVAQLEHTVQSPRPGRGFFWCRKHLLEGQTIVGYTWIYHGYTMIIHDMPQVIQFQYFIWIEDYILHIFTYLYISVQFVSSLKYILFDAVLRCKNSCLW